MVGLFLSRQQGTTAVTGKAASPALQTRQLACIKTCMVTTSDKEQHADEGWAEVMQIQPDVAGACVPG